nr:hypothetical protein [Treponema sp.]
TVAVFLSAPLFSLSREDFSLSVEPLFSIRSGQIDEYVFLKKTNYDSDKLSELNWDLKPELNYGLKIKGGFRGFFEETHFTAGIPMNTGIMADSDWFNIAKSGLSSNMLYKTNYSESDNYLDYDFSFGFKGGYEFKLFNFISLKPALAFEYQNIKFTGKNGTAWYGNAVSGTYAAWNDEDNRTIKDFSGKKVIAYQRILYYFWLGSDFAFKLPAIPHIPGNFIIDTGFFFTPYLYCVSYDQHCLTGTDYADLTPGYMAAFKWNLGLTYQLSKRHAIIFNADYFYMRLLRGKDYQKSNSSTKYTLASDAEGGAGASYFDFTISYRFNIF